MNQTPKRTASSAGTRIAVAVILCCICAVPAQVQPRQPSDVSRALVLYDAGRYDEFDAVMAAQLEAVPFPQFEAAAKRWLGPDRVGVGHRHALVAASVALELAYRLRDQPADRAARYLVWASLLVRQHAPQVPTTAERHWHLAAIATMQALDDEPWALTAGLPSGSAVMAPLVSRMGRGGHLAVALARLPNEPRLLLVRVTAAEARIGWGLGASASFLDVVRAQAKAVVPEDPDRAFAPALADRDNARAILSAFQRVPPVISMYGELAGHPSLWGEVSLRVGRLEGLLMNWGPAREGLRRSRELSDDPFLRYLSHYFEGHVLERSGDRAGAIDAFQQAAGVVPKARSAATRLGALLMLTDRQVDRRRAYEILQGAYTGASQSVDPWTLYGRPEARMWTAHVTQLRKALQ